MLLKLGMVLDERYEIISPIGEGGFGTVYRARDLNLNRDVALKFLKSGQYHCTDDDLARIKRESKLLARIVHTNIVSVYALEIIEPFGPIMVMEYLQGKSLKQYIGEHPQGLPAQECRSILSQLCAALAYAHAESIVHRDLSSNNVIIQFNNNNKNPVAKIIDFGLSKFIATPEASAPTQSLTKTGTLLGNPLYMSPEACRGDKLDERSDIYSLGCILYEMLSGKTIFAADEAIGILFKQQNEYPDKPMLKWKDQAEEKLFLDILLACIEKEREKRIVSAKSILSALAAEPVALQEINKSAGAWRSLKSRSAPNKSTLLKAILLVLLIFLGAASSFLLMKKKLQGDEIRISDASTLKLRHLLQTLKRKENRYGQGSPQLIEPLMALSDYYFQHQNMDLEESRKVLNRLISVLEKEPGKENEKIEVLRRLRSLGEAAQVDPESRISWLEQEKTLTEQKFGRDSREYVYILSELGHAYASQNKTSKKAELVLKAAVGEARHLQEQVVLVDSLHTLSQFYNNVGRHREALATLEEARKIAYEAMKNQPGPTLGPVLQGMQGQPYLERATITSLKALQHEYSIAMRFDKAESTCEEALKLVDKINSRVPTKETAIQRSELLRLEAIYTRTQSDSRKTLQLLRRSLAEAKKADDPANLGFCYMELAEYNRYLHKYGTAEKYFRQAMEQFKKSGALFQYRFHANNCLVNIAFCKAQYGDLTGAKAVCNDLVQKVRNTKTIDRQTEAACLEMLGNIAKDEKDYKKALAYYLEAIKVDNAQSPVNEDRVCSCLLAAVFACDRINDSNQALSLKKEAESIALKTVAEAKQQGKKDKVRRDLYRLAEVYISQGNFGLAAKTIESETSIHTDVPLNTIDYAWSYRHMGDCYKIAENFGKAEEWYWKAINTLAKEYGSNDQHLAGYYASLAHCYFMSKKDKQAAEIYKKALELWTDTQPSDMDQRGYTLKDYIILLKRMGNASESEIYQKKLDEIKVLRAS